MLFKTLSPASRMTICMFACVTLKVGPFQQCTWGFYQFSLFTSILSFTTFVSMEDPRYNYNLVRSYSHIVNVIL